jgi:hypothetical protein
MTLTKRQLVELLEKYPEDTQVMLELAHDAEEGDLLNSAEVQPHATIDAVVLIVKDSYHEDDSEGDEDEEDDPV